MALSPVEVAQRRDTARAEQKAALETQIDQALSAQIEAGPTPVEVGAAVAASVVDGVVNSYRDVGWSVGVDVDFHGNRKLSFAVT